MSRRLTAGVPLAGIVAAVALGATIVTIGLGALAWWLFVPHPQPPEARAMAGASSEGPTTGEGYAFWELNADGTPVRWDPCSPIELVLSEVSMPRGARADLAQAVDQLREVTGLDLEVVDVTDERPAGDRPPYQPERYGDRWAPVLVAWADPGAADLPLRTTDRGVAVAVAVGPTGDRTYISGQVVLNAGRDDLRAGFTDRADSWGATLLHELGHLLGLAHVDDPDQLMATFPGEGAVRFGPGDRAGLGELSAGTGCRDVPPAGHVTVTGHPG